MKLYTIRKRLLLDLKDTVIDALNQQIELDRYHTRANCRRSNLQKQIEDIDTIIRESK